MRYTSPAIQRFSDSVLNEQLDLELGFIQSMNRPWQDDRPSSSERLYFPRDRPDEPGELHRVPRCHRW
jgi:hypothetical protein